MACGKKYNDYTVKSLLEEAGRARRRLPECGCRDTDHIVEFQLVVAALNTLPKNTYKGADWQKDLVDFFNDKYTDNLMCLAPQKNKEKGVAVTRFIKGQQLLSLIHISEPTRPY